MKLGSYKSRACSTRLTRETLNELTELPASYIWNIQELSVQFVYCIWYTVSACDDGLPLIAAEYLLALTSVTGFINFEACLWSAICFQSIDFFFDLHSFFPKVPHILKLTTALNYLQLVRCSRQQHWISFHHYTSEFISQKLTIPEAITYRA